VKTNYLTQEAFDNLLRWLDSDRERAGEKYESIRSRLILFFSKRGMSAAEDLADETINRVASKIPDIVDSYIGDPALYFYGVARKVSLEYLRQKPTAVLPETVYSSEQGDYEQIHSCFERCFQKLPPKQRELLLAYYMGPKRGKLYRKGELTKRLGIKYNALRVRAYRLRIHLEKCIQTCLEQKTH
jgi:DNA-directed RNA polymerase specialized sigma24 family protein